MLDITRQWYRQSLGIFSIVLLPFSFLFGGLISLRRWLYRVGLFKSIQFSAPVIVIGNITVGGTGKTPFVIWLAHFLRAQGYHPGIVSRGYGGKQRAQPVSVTAASTPAEVGDESILLMKNTHCPVVVCADRVAAVQTLLQLHHCDIVLSDDGLQHYRLGRRIEIAIVDAARGFGNKQLLPAGPLREPMSRLRSVNFVIRNGDPHGMVLEQGSVIALKDAANTCKLEDFPHKKVHAVAGIGNPERFFNALKSVGFDVIAHAFPDHHQFRAHELEFHDALPILMTEKDAVKCAGFANERYWYVSVNAKVHHEWEEKLLHLLEIKHADETEADFSRHTCRLASADQREQSRE